MIHGEHLLKVDQNAQVLTQARLQLGLTFRLISSKTMLRHAWLAHSLATLATPLIAGTPMGKSRTSPHCGQPTHQRRHLPNVGTELPGNLPGLTGGLHGENQQFAGKSQRGLIRWGCVIAVFCFVGCKMLWGRPWNWYWAGSSANHLLALQILSGLPTDSWWLRKQT